MTAKEKDEELELPENEAEEDEGDDEEEQEAAPEGEADAEEKPEAEGEEKPAAADEAKRKRRAEERKIRREMSRQRKMEDKLTIQRLREEVIALKRNNEYVLQSMQKREQEDADARMNNVRLRFADAERRAAEALDKGDSKTFLHYQKEMLSAKDEYDGLVAVKPVADQPKAKAEPNMVAVKVAKWAAKNDYDNWSPREKQLAKAIDQEMADEGLDPNTDSYYDTLNERLKEYLPTRFGASAKPAQQRPQARPVTGGASGDLSVVNNSPEKGLPKEYVEMCKRFGKWDSPEDRKRMRERYFESVKQNGKRA